MERTLKVLFVDDDQMVQEIARSILGQEGDLAVEVASSGEIALNKLDHVKYDAVITDYLMPGINGVDLIREARKKGCESIFILFTGKGSEEIATDSLVIGAEYYFLKSGDAKTDLDLIKATLRQNGSKAEVRPEQGTWHSQLVTRMTEGFAHFQAITDTSGVPTGYLVREINASFERITGIGRENVVGTKLGNGSRDIYIDLVSAFEEIDQDGNGRPSRGLLPSSQQSPEGVNILAGERSFHGHDRRPR